jgi:predicted dehydrogenase
MNISPSIRAILIGAGQRGADVYGLYAQHHPDQIRFVAVAEPNPARRARFAEQHGIPSQYQFESWEPLLTQPQFAQTTFVCTQDGQHTAPTLAAMRAGYDVLLEKPMATTATECKKLVHTSEETGRQLHIAHVLRYTRHFETMREIIRSGALGQIITVDHRENVSWWHMAHSYVRGNWRNSEEACPMILAKCCHDLDILLWLLDGHCESLSSVGGLMHYRAENAPEGAPARCLDGCPVEETCPHYAPFIYIDLLPLWRAIANTGSVLPKLAAAVQTRSPELLRFISRFYPDLRRISEYRDWPISVLALDPTSENLLNTLKTGPYGRCVYHCDNNVVDHQVVAMRFSGGQSVTLTMNGHAHYEGRTTRIQGSLAELRSFFGTGGAWIEVKDHRAGRRTQYNTSVEQRDGHGGGDQGLIKGFVRSIREAEQHARTSAHRSLESHLMAFAAEQARIEGRVIDLGVNHP